MADLVTFGETMLRLSPPGATPVETAERFDVHAAGAESNVAVAAGRLGVEAAWVSKLPDTGPGRRVAGAVRRHGVEPAVAWTEDGRQGIYYLDGGGRPRGRNVLYDRADSAVTTATPGELPTDLVESARRFHTSGITPALSETLRATTADLLARAREAGAVTSLDVNYRSKLWSPAEARETLTDLFPVVDDLVVAERDARRVLDRSGDPADLVRGLAADGGFETAVLTRGEEPVLAVYEGTLFEQPPFPADDDHPVGTGDAFVGGFLAKRLQGGSVPDALTHGAATAAYKRAVPGDMAVVTPADVERVIEGGVADISR